MSELRRQLDRIADNISYYYRKHPADHWIVLTDIVQALRAYAEPPKLLSERGYTVALPAEVFDEFKRQMGIVRPYSPPNEMVIGNITFLRKGEGIE
jgi:hypothetical protein